MVITIRNVLKQLLMLDEDERVWAAYNINGRTLVEWHLANEAMLDRLNSRAGGPELIVHNYVEGEVHHDPTYIRLFVDEFPPKLKVYGGVFGITEYGHGRVRDRWWALIDKALSKIQGELPRFNEHVLIYYRFHFQTYKADPDQFAIKYITDRLAYRGIFASDTFLNVSVMFTGTYSPENPGTEIFVCEYRRALEILPLFEKR